MKLTNSLLRDLITEYSVLRPQIYFKSSLIALARAIQDVAVANSDHQYLVIANLQQEQFFRQTERHFRDLTSNNSHIYILGVPEVESSFAITNPIYETIPIQATDTLAGEAYLVIIGKQYCACIIAQERFSVKDLKEDFPIIEQGKRFEGIWSFERDIVYSAADWLLGMIANYRPELKAKTEQSRKLFQSYRQHHRKSFLAFSQLLDLGIFTQRLVTYLQASQYKLFKAYKAIAIAERKEHLINKIAQAQTQSLDPQEILQVTVRELGKIFPQCRCLLYRINPNDTQITIKHESVPNTMPSLLGQSWLISNNPIFIVAQTQDSAIVINNVTDNVYIQENSILKEKIERAAIDSWLMVSIRYQKNLLGILELHHSGIQKFKWQPEDINLVEAVANSAGTALTQASAYKNLVKLNQQLAAVEKIQSNLIAVVGHELRTPLSTIRICLESLAGEPNMPSELRATMLDTALSDSERLGQLIQDFLTLSKLETGKVYRNIESVSLEYPLNLALHRIKKTSRLKTTPSIKVQLSSQLPLVVADVEGLVEIFYKLLDNACKFTGVNGEILIEAQPQTAFDQTSQIKGDAKSIVKVTISDTGRGIELDQLEKIFDRFSQSEHYLRRTVNGTGLGLVICRQIINGIGGAIWATSKGKDKGSQFHLTLPTAF